MAAARLTAATSPSTARGRRWRGCAPEAAAVAGGGGDGRIRDRRLRFSEAVDCSRGNVVCLTQPPASLSAVSGSGGENPRSRRQLPPPPLPPRRRQS
uniref:Uncharacterized protein n=1 Tax=Leersia perrieri TaxID=77586 RepID=A0A0D9X2V6_9ORYZ